MGKRLLALAAALVLLFGFAGTGIMTVYAEEFTDSIDVLAADYLSALESGETSYAFRTTADDIDELMNQLFSAYPMLHHYYASGTFLDYQTHLEVTFNFTNTEDPLEELWVVGSDKDLMAVMGLCIAQAQPEIEFVTKDGYLPDETAFERVIQQIHDQHSMAYMGYYTRSYSCVSQDAHDVRNYTVKIQYHDDLDTATLLQWRQVTESAVLDLTNSLVAMDMPDYLKVLLIHDWIVNNTRYNLDNMEEPGNHVAYGPLVKGTGVCMGYAEAGLLLFQAVGLDARYISGTATNSAGVTEGHAWNAVKIDGEWYLVDMTWDDPTTDTGEDILRYDYFLLTDDQMAQNHTWDPTGVPVCSSTAWNAELALAAYEQDAGGYSGYGDAEFKTVDQSLSEFRQALNSASEEFEARQSANAFRSEESSADLQEQENSIVKRSMISAAAAASVLLVSLRGKRRSR